MGYLFLGLAIVSEVVATSFLKFTSGERAVWWAYIVVVAGYGLSFWMLSLTLSAKVPLGIAYRDPDTTFGDEDFGAHMRRVAAMSKVEVALEAGEPLVVAGRRAEATAEQARQRVAELVRRARARLDGLGSPPATR